MRRTARPRDADERAAARERVENRPGPTQREEGGSREQQHCRHGQQAFILPRGRGTSTSIAPQEEDPGDAEQHEDADEVGPWLRQCLGGRRSIARPRPSDVEALPQPRRDQAEHGADIEPGRHPRRRTPRHARSVRGRRVDLREETRERKGECVEREEDKRDTRREVRAGELRDDAKGQYQVPEQAESGGNAAPGRGVSPLADPSYEEQGGDHSEQGEGVTVQERQVSIFAARRAERVGRAPHHGAQRVECGECQKEPGFRGDQASP